MYKIVELSSSGVSTLIQRSFQKKNKNKKYGKGEDRILQISPLCLAFRFGRGEGREAHSRFLYNITIALTTFKR